MLSVTSQHCASNILLHIRRSRPVIAAVVGTMYVSLNTHWLFLLRCNTDSNTHHGEAGMDSLLLCPLSYPSSSTLFFPCSFISGELFSVHQIHPLSVFSFLSYSVFRITVALQIRCISMGVFIINK